jgi:hypothetical protein
MCIPFILISRVPGFGFSKVFQFLGYILVALVIIIAQVIAATFIVSATTHESTDSKLTLHRWLG